MDNISLFKFSLDNPEEGQDKIYKKGNLFITEDPNKKNSLMQKNEKMIDLITTYENMANRFTGKQENDFINQIDLLLFDKNDRMNYTALSQFFMACDTNFNVLQKQKKEERKNNLRKLIKEYIKERHSVYKKHVYSNIVLQVVADNYSHKRHGSSGTNKIKSFLEDFGIMAADKNTNLYKDNFYLLTDKDGKKIFKQLLNERGIKLIWSKNKQGKMPDVFIQHNNNTYIIEHKHKKEAGGGQNSQNTEIVDFIKYTEKDISFITYMDGILFNDLASEDSKAKSKTTKNDIIRYLKKNKNNYFVNTKGFEKLLEEVVLKRPII